MSQVLSPARVAAALSLTIALASSSAAQQGASGRAGRGGQGARPTTPPAPTRADTLRGQYGPERANNDLLHYDLDIRFDPDKRTIGGKNTIRFKMLSDAGRIQIDLHQALNVDKILLADAGSPLKYTRDERAVYIDFPQQLKKGNTYSIAFYYSGTPAETGRGAGGGGGVTYRKDANGKPFINTVCEGIGSSTWWPSKDQWHDEPDEGIDMKVAVPNGLMDVSNGTFVGSKDLGDGYTRWDWRVTHNINSYDVSLNIGDYVHFTDKYKDMTLNFYVLRDSLSKAQAQFGQAKGMLAAYEHYFGEYPFKSDGYKLVEASNAGMEHQSAVTYGNGFKNGYGGRDWTGVGISPRFDFIIIHESGHEWFGNAVSAADRSDMWIHEGWTTYLEGLFVEYTYGHDDAIRYLNGYKPKIRNQQPIVATRGIGQSPPEDQYFKGALMLNSLRSVVNDDKKWFQLMHDTFQHFKYRNIMTEEMVQYFNQQTGMNLTPIFDQYLRHAALPTLQLKFDDAAGTVAYRWQADEAAFAMPIRVGNPSSWQIVQPTTTEWKTMKTSLKKDDFQVATDLYYVNVAKE